jgi:P-type Cu+ transporter
MATDPVCGMFVDASTASLRLTRDNRTYYFCSAGCLRTFAEPERERNRLVRRLLIAWPLSVVIVVLTYAVGGTAAAYLAAALAAVVQFYSGGPFYLGARDAFRNRSANMDVLIAVGTSAAFLYSVAVLALPGRLPSAYYFDASALIVTLILTGNYLEHLTRARAGSALRRLDELLPPTASVLRNGVEVAVPVAEVKVGDSVRVRPGGRFPTDGVVRRGRTSVDESLLTGEAVPVPKAPGDRVLAGAINAEGLVEVEASNVGADTFLAQVGRLLTDAEMSRVPLQATADRIASVFVPFVLAIAMGSALFWYFVGGASFTVGLLVFVTVAITACPCAFGIATPAAIVVGTGRAAEQGILFRGADALERAARADVVLTDKTGTLTSPTPVLADATPSPGRTVEELLSLAAGVESGSEHALARAVTDAAKQRNLAPRAVTGIRADPGRGARGLVDGRPVAILRGDAARAEGADLAPVGPAIARAETQGDSWSVVTLDGRTIGLLAFHAEVVPGARAGVEALHALGIETVMVTGDLSRAAQRVGAELGIREVFAGVDPAAKVERVADYRRRGRHVAFVGDGINDAPALAAADVGLAIGTGADVAREAGQVLLFRSDFSGVPLALQLARRTVERVRRNLEWAIGYNVVLLPIAAGLLVPLWGFGIYAVLPILGAAAMGLSSTTVVVNSLSLRWAALEGRPRRVPPRVTLPQ